MKEMFLSHGRKNSEMRQGGQESKLSIYLSKSTLSKGERADRWVAAPSFLGKPVMWGVQMKGRNIHCRRKAWGSCSLIFIPAPPSRGEEGFLSLYTLDWKCHGASVWWVFLICKANFYCNENIMSKRLHLDTGDSHLSLSATPGYVVSCQSGGSCFSLSACGPQDAWFPAIWPVLPFLCSHLATCLFFWCIFKKIIN